MPPITVRNANPAGISGVGVAQPRVGISGVGVAQPSSRITGVGVAQPRVGISGVGVAGSLAQQVASNQASLGQGNAEYQRLLGEINRLSSQLNQRVYAPRLDFAAINAQARQQAEANVNPLYTKYLNQYLQQQAAKRAQREQEYKFTIQDIEDTLRQTQEANVLGRQRTTEDVAQNLADINLSADQYQTDTGQEFEQARLGQAQQLAASGLATSGLGRQQQRQLGEQATTAEQRQEQTFETARQAQQLFKSRTLEDLLKSDELANLTAGKGKERAKFDLDAYIENARLEEEQKRTSLDVERQGAVLAATGDIQSQLVRNFINSIGDPAQRQAAIEAYGGLL